MAGIEDQIRELFTEQLKLEPSKIAADASIKEDLGADSLDTTELIMAIESKFNVSIPDDEALQLLTFGDVLRCVQSKIEQPSKTDSR